jgi:hypothetical protein
MGEGYSRNILYGNYLGTVDRIQRGTGWHKGSAIVTKPWKRNYQNEGREAL